MLFFVLVALGTYGVLRLMANELREQHAREQVEPRAKAEANRKAGAEGPSGADRIASDGLRVKRLARSTASLLIRKGSISGKSEL